MEKQKIDGLQVLRAIAACAVVWSHAYSRAHRIWPQNSSILDGVYGLDSFGNFGVDLFFVLSGFLMAHLHANQMGANGAAINFIVRRIIRIVPIYWLLSSFGLLLLVAEPNLFSYHKGYEAGWVIGCFLFIPWPMYDGFNSPIIGAG